MKRLLASFIVIAAGTLLLPFLMVQGQEQAQTGGIRRVANPIPGQYIVVLKDDDASPDEKPGQSQDQNIDQSQGGKWEALADDLNQRHGGGVKHVYTSALKGFSTEMSEAGALALSRDPRVEYVEEDGEVWGAACSQSTQPSATWNLDRIDQADQPLSTTYTYVFTGTGVNVYVIDSGLRTTHLEFDDGRATNVFDRDGGSGADCNGHGTHVAGIIGGSARGVAKHVKLYGVRVLGCDNRGSNSDVIRGVDWVTQNHKKPAIANMSLSGGASSAIDDAVKRSIAAGVTYVTAAGNGTDNDGVAVDARNFSPGRVEQAITVGATDSLDNRASFSNFGPAVDVFAPGVSVKSTWNTDDTSYNTMPGTSMAAPHVAGVAAMILEADPGASPARIESLIQELATKDKVVNPGTGSANRLLNSLNVINRFATLAITDQPDDVAVCPGHPGAFSVAATGVKLRYQWYKDGYPLVNVRSPKFTIVTATANDLGAYHVVITDNCLNSVTSRRVRLSFKPAPELIDQPDDVIACLGHRATFSVMATGAKPRYQWYKDGSPINIKSPEFTIVSVTANDLGAYYVVVTDECGASVTSRTVKLSLAPAPVFVSQPADAEVCAGQQARFSASANGAVRYQWYKDGVPITYATGPTLILVAPRAEDEGLYHVVAINQCGGQTESRKARLSLGGPVTITQQPISLTARAGQSVTFSVAATGGILKFKWRKNGGNILGAGSEGSSFTIPAVSAADAGAYTVVVYNQCGPAKESAAATLTLIMNDSRFIIQNAPVTMVAGQRYNVSVTFRNTGASTWTAANGYKLVSQAPLNNLNWGLNEVPLPSSVAPGADATFSFTVTAPATPGRYRFDWRVTQGAAGFGGFTPGLEVTVTQ